MTKSEATSGKANEQAAKAWRAPVVHLREPLALETVKEQITDRMTFAPLS